MRLNAVVVQVWLSVAVLLVMISTSEQCDTRLIRKVYYQTCGGKKKRKNPDYSEFLDNSGGVKNSINSPLLMALTGRSEAFEIKQQRFFDEDLVAHSRIAAESAFRKDAGGVEIGGMTRQDSLRILEDFLVEDDANEVQRRGLSRLIQKCCYLPPFKCTAQDFGAEC